ncbi:MAG: prephenate dehydratase [Acidobacteriota bacterium]|nr:prephenate dehydratase [Acidobacteriota bacterium]
MPAERQKERSPAVISPETVRPSALGIPEPPSRREAQVELGDIRRRIDAVDARLVRLLTERMELALRAGKTKARVQDPGREEAVLNNILRSRPGPLSEEFLLDLFQRIISECRTAEEAHPSLVGFQGEHGAYSEEAARTACPESVPIPFRGFRDIFDGVGGGRLDLGIVPVENSTEGAVAEVNDLLLEYDLFIIREIRFPIRHKLLVPPGIDPGGLKTVMSHPQALAQCRRFLRDNGLDAQPVYDTAGAARRLSDNPGAGTAVIASHLCADLYGLEIAAENIEDEPSNRTRFLVLSRAQHTGAAAKGSLAFSTRHEAGALCAVLDVFRERRINLLRIESRPVKTDPGTYVFFVDFAGSPRDAGVAEALAAARERATFWKFFGGYEEV